MPAYGGSLFDPDRFPFLTATNEHGTLAVTVSDRVMLHVLRSVQIAERQGRGARRISFRDIDVEQIGYIYEGLLGYTVRHGRPDLPRARSARPAPSPRSRSTTLDELADSQPGPEEARRRDPSPGSSEDQPSAKAPSAAALAKALATPASTPTAISALTQAVGDDLELRRPRPPVARR